MMRCCVLEDNNEDLNKIVACIKSDHYLNDHLEIQTFYSPSQIHLSTDNFDILLLDIDLPEQSGIDFANEYLKMHPNSKVIFITTHNELVFDTFKVHPYSFIRKEYMHIELNDSLHDLLDLIKLNKKELIISDKGHAITIQQSDIIYIESFKHYCYIYTKGCPDPYKTRISMYHVIKDLAFYFYRVNRSYIINLNEIKKIQNGKVTLKNNLEVSIQRGQTKKFQNTYNDFICKKTLL